MKRKPELDLTSFRAALIFALLAAIGNAVWILLDHSSPPWDQAHYLSVSLQYRHAFDSEGILGLLRAIRSVDTSRGPLFPILITPFVTIFGAGARGGMILNILLAPVLYLAAGQIAWIVFRSWAARLLTILLVATMPLLVGLYHNVFQDFLLATLATVAILLLLLSDRFQRRWLCAGLGLAIGLGTLTKVTFPIFVVGPLLVVAAQIALSWRERGQRGSTDTRPNLRELATNLALAGGVFLVVVLPWYLPNFSATREYAQSTTSGPLSIGAGPKHPLTFEAITSFTANLVNSDVSWIVGLVGLIAIALNLPALRALFRRPANVDRLLKLALLLSWLLIPYLFLVTAHNQDVRLMAAAMPAVAVIVAGAIAAVRSQRVRAALVAVAVIALGYQTLNHVTSITPGFLPKDVSLKVSSYSAVIHLDDEPIGYEQLPGPDYATPIVDYLQRAVERGPDSSAAHSVCLLETEPVVNDITLGFVAATHGDPLVFFNVHAQPEDGSSLASTLSSCNFAIYARQSRPSPNLKDVRLTLVNEEFAARAMTPRLFRLFPGASRVFSTGTRPEVEGEDKYASVAGKADRVRVLIRHP